MREVTRGDWSPVFLSLAAIINASFAQSPVAGPRFDCLGGQIQTRYSHTREVEFELRGGYWKGGISDARSILNSPSGWKRSDWIEASLIVGIAAGLYACDQKIQRWGQRRRNNTSDEICRFVKPLGDGRYTLPPLGMLYLYGHFFSEEKARMTALLGLEGFVVSGIFTQAIKFAGHRHRPSTGDSHNTWDGPSFSTHHLSFPSGHSSSAFTISTVLASQYEDKVLIPTLAYSMATLTALSRVNDNSHWASDVFFGSAIGYFVAKAIVDLHSNKDKGLCLLPVIDDSCGALLAFWNF